MKDFFELFNNKRIDFLLSLLLFLFVLFSATSRLDYDCKWGDDFAAYINEAIAIADGTYDEQIRLNYRMHPSELSADAKSGELIYAWGYPLILAQIYKLVGFDRGGFHSIPYYKMVSVFSLALLACTLYYFFRRSLSRPTSVVFSGWLSFNIITEIDSLYSDVFFFSLMIVSLVLAETYFKRPKKGVTASNVLLGFLLGSLLFLVKETRLNGSAIVALIVFMNVCYVILHRKISSNLLGRDNLFFTALPYLVFLLLLVTCEVFLLHTPTSNSSDLAKTSWQTIHDNFLYYAKLFQDFFVNSIDISGNSLIKSTLSFIFCIFFVIGLIRNFKKDYAFFPMLLFFVGNLLALVLLPYTQGVRYCYPILPIIAFFLGSGIDSVVIHFSRKMKKNTRSALSVTLLLISCIYIVIIAVNHSEDDFKRMLQGEEVGRERTYSAYSAQALETYHYIIDYTPADSIIAFRKPRALYLNTQRESFQPLLSRNEDRHSDYYLVCTDFNTEKDYAFIDSHFKSIEVVFSNSTFTLYRINAAKH